MRHRQTVGREGGETDRERQRDRQRQRQTERDRQTERQRQTETERDRDRQTQTDRQTDRQKHTGRQKERLEAGTEAGGSEKWRREEEVGVSEGRAHQQQTD